MIINIYKTMRYPAEHKQQTRERIVKAASRRFRSRGTEGAAIGDLMRDLRLTHGGFYRHFDSKEALVAEAFEQSLREIADRILGAADKLPANRRLKGIIDAYLDPKHCEDVADGCPIAALTAEIARRPKADREPYLRILRAHAARVAAYLPGATPEERRQKAVALLSGMAGTLALARTLTSDDSRRAVLAGARDFYLHAAQR